MTSGMNPVEMIIKNPWGKKMTELAFHNSYPGLNSCRLLAAPPEPVKILIIKMVVKGHVEPT